MASALSLTRCQPTGITPTSQTGDTVAPLSDDAKRFQGWQRDALEAHPPSTRLLSAGPFHALLPADQQGRSGWMTLVDGHTTEGETQDALAQVRSAMGGRRIDLEIEY